jgi:hypothetical protein
MWLGRGFIHKQSRHVESTQSSSLVLPYTDRESAVPDHAMLELRDWDKENSSTHSVSARSANPRVAAGICVSSGKTWNVLNAIQNQNHRISLISGCGYVQGG